MISYTFPQPWQKFLPHGTAHLGEGEQYATPHPVHLVEGLRLCIEPAVHVNSVVDVFRSVDLEIGEDVDEYLVRKLEYYEAVVGSGGVSSLSERKMHYLGSSGSQACAGLPWR